MKNTISNIFVILYLATTLFLRLVVEAQLKGYWAISVLFGIFGLLFLWALMKNRIITPTILGLDKYFQRETQHSGPA
ncbi:MAG: hypothetical protein IPH94_09395 [Saprospiraceae bacterium]|nr:hypothetical protein [Saprospiraceae bacterium]MBK7221524.1 hypothetical protein [Saprospiraceae bacterium]MBK7788394.1 hypothetical protein [Saprospiraceae bacterium]MBK8110968.1 hypothetical protein [Saprospiraceae bacterium]MBK8851610.1 hypothetical protein [Saprospiraceae bacterium]